MKNFNVINEEILVAITPTQTDRAKIDALAQELKQKVSLACKEKGVKAAIRIEGSVAKGTWLKEDPEIDIFMRLPPTIPRGVLGKISLEIARKATAGSQQVERFAEHPYLEAFIGDVRLNIVPCYDVKGGQWLSATDRTPFHTEYVKKFLDEDLRGEVRLLKKFLQGINVYGAEIKTGGFSGYLCELLILHYKSFIGTLQAFASYKQRVCIDIEGGYTGREKELDHLFPAPLVVIDPVDRTRNVASAVRSKKLCTLVAASRVFLKTPNVKFFYPPKRTVLSPKVLKANLQTRGSSILFVLLGRIDAVPDVLWGQLYRTQRALRRLVRLNGFNVLRDDVWSDETTFSVFVFELEQHALSSIKAHLGPPLKREKECENFLGKYKRNHDVVSGPYIEDCRWVVEIPRKFTNVVELLGEKLKDGGKSVGVAELMSQAFREKLKVLINSEVTEIYVNNRRFAEFLTDFIIGKPFWLYVSEA
jgi:tRNA nucleotidyltransferase (CCA-adding enzyme)